MAKQYRAFIYFICLFFGTQIKTLTSADDTIIELQHRAPRPTPSNPIVGPNHCECTPGQQEPRFIAEYAYIFSTQSTVIAPTDPIPFDQNGPITNGISHSTLSNSDQIIINVAGVYRIDYTTTSADPKFFAISVNGVVQTSSEYGTTRGSMLKGMVILSLSSGDVIRVTNYSIATTTTLSNISSGNPRIPASILINQIA